MENGWVKIRSYGQLFEAELEKGLLLDNGILCVVVNGQDSTFMFGDISLYVSQAEYDSALELLNANSDLE